MHIVNSAYKDLINKKFTREDLESILATSDTNILTSLYSVAREITDRYYGRNIYLRGLIEISNICRKDCYYCGIRKSNATLQRYVLTFDEVIGAIRTCYENGFASIVLQAGEQRSKKFIQFIARCIRMAKKISNDKLAITLSLGEQSKDVYQYWYDFGADRYLLRIETSDPKLYQLLHPEDHDFEYRQQCLYMLKEIGYQVGTGVLIGVPYQTIQHLANDILFYKRIDVDMIGMGPYIPHWNTPLATIAQNYNKTRVVTLTLLMIALTRIVCPDVNIASTTALEVLDRNAVIQSFNVGANVKMINITPRKKELYDLYDGKSKAIMDWYKFQKKLIKNNFIPCYNTPGTSFHFIARNS